MGSLNMVANTVGGQLFGGDRDFDAVSTDSRTIQPRDLFFALRGERFDGTAFVDAAAMAGAAGAVVEHRSGSELPQIVVKDARGALGTLAKTWRANFDVPVVAVTGSNGKTTVKEMLASILRQQHGDAVLVTLGNLNNDIGLPLTVLRLNEAHKVAVLEMGASARQEIAYLAQIAAPDIGVVTNAGAAHLEGFGSLEDVAAAKGELFESLAADAVAIINRDDHFYDYWVGLCGQRRQISFGLHADADCRATNIHEVRVSGQTVLQFDMMTPAADITVTLAMAGRHNVLNALAAAAAALAAGAGAAHIEAGLAAAGHVAGRLKTIRLPSGVSVIDDSYNANPASVKAAIEYLATQPGQRWLVLGDMAELGAGSEALHRGIGATAKAAGIDRLYCTGRECRAVADEFGDTARWFESREALTAALHAGLSGAGEMPGAILIKGSRCMGLEKVVQALTATDDKGAAR